MGKQCQFREYYNSLSDDALMHLALSEDLLPEAVTALNAELSMRGIFDISEYRKQFFAEADAEEVWRQEQIELRRRASHWKSKFLYCSGLLAIAYGLFRIYSPDKDEPDDVLFVVFGIGILMFTYIATLLQRLIFEKFFYRR